MCIRPDLYLCYKSKTHSGDHHGARSSGYSEQIAFLLFLFLFRQRFSAGCRFEHIVGKLGEPKLIMRFVDDSFKLWIFREPLKIKQISEYIIHSVFLRLIFDLMNMIRSLYIYTKENDQWQSIYSYSQKTVSLFKAFLYSYLDFTAYNAYNNVIRHICDY